MPQHVRLSNGAPLDIPDNTPREEIRARVDQAETAIRAQAHPVASGVLSDLARRAVGAYGLYRNTVQPVAESAGRIAGAGSDLFPPVGMYDFGASGYNAIKPHIPSVKNLPDAPIASNYATQAIGAPPLPANAPMWQRYGEGAITGALGAGKTALTGAGKMIASMATGDIGASIANRFGGPDWTQFGRWLGSVPGAMPDKVLGEPARAIIAKTAGRQAQDVDAAGTQLGGRPTFGALANPPMRLIEKGLNAMPVVNFPGLRAKQRMEDAIVSAKTNAAEDINRGPLPASTDQGSVGTNLIALARQRSAAIKTEASQRFKDLESDPRAGPDTLINAQPVLDRINQMMNDPSVSGEEIALLQGRAAYLQSMMHGGVNYRGQQIPNAPPGTMTLGALGKFRSELGADLQNLPALQEVPAGRVRDAITGVLQNEYGARGMGPDFQQANDFYRDNIGVGTPTAALDVVGGTPVKGKPGAYEGGMDEQAAYRFLASHTQSPSEIEPFVDANSPYWRAASAQFIDSLGRGKQGQDAFRADQFGPKMQGISPDVLAQLTRSQGGGPLQPTMANLRAAEVLANNSSVPVERLGLTNSIGSLAALEALGGWLGHQYADAGVPAVVAVPATLAALHAGLQSKSVADAMAGRTTSTPLTDALYQAVPIASTATNLDNRQAQPVDTPRPPSPLDQLNQPNQFLPQNAPPPAQPTAPNMFLPQPAYSP